MSGPDHATHPVVGLPGARRRIGEVDILLELRPSRERRETMREVAPPAISNVIGDVHVLAGNDFFTFRASWRDYIGCPLCSRQPAYPYGHRCQDSPHPPLSAITKAKKGWELPIGL